MDLQYISEEFNSLSPHEKIKFIYTKIDNLPKEDKIHFLLSIINDLNLSPIIRSTALKFLPRSGYYKPDIFKKSLEDPDPAVVQAAKRALKEISLQNKKEKSVSKSELNEKEYAYEKQKRLKILKDMARLDDSRVPKLLLEELEEASEEIRNFIIHELVHREDLNLNTVHQKLLTSPWYVRGALLKILAHKKSQSSVEHVEGVLEDPNTEVREIAAHTLGEIGGEKASELLMRLTKDKNPHVRKQALEALEKASRLRFI